MATFSRRLISPKIGIIEKVGAQNEKGTKIPIQTWSRASVILPEFVGHTFNVHNGKNFISVYLTENSPAAVASYRAVRDAWVGDAAPPAATLLVVAGLATPALLRR